MSAKVTKTNKPAKTKVIDDVGLDKQMESSNELLSKEDGDSNMDNIDNKVLEELKEKLSQNVEKEVQEEKNKDQVSLKFGIVGCGHAGSRLAEAFYKLGYSAVALNTATQDLIHIEIPEENKLFMDIGLQGSAKDLNRGEEAAVTYREQIQDLIYKKLDTTQVLIICSSAGGGSGAGSLSTVIDVANTTGKPIVLMSVLPMVSEDVKTKSNSLETISKLASYVTENKVQSFILVDNAKIESIHSGVGQMDFYKIANRSIVEPLDAFNIYSMKPSQFKALDSAEWATILLNSGGVSTYGKISIEDYEGELAISKAIIDSLQKNMLVSGLDYKQAKYVGYIIIANSNAWKKIPTGATNYANALINEIFGNPECTYKGIYESDMKEDMVQIYTFVSGLGVPDERISVMKKDIESQQINLKVKDVDRTKQLKVDLTKDNTVNEVDKIKAKIASKMSGLGKLTSLGKK